MASEKPVSGPDQQPAGLISVGAGGGGGGGSSSVAVMGELRASGSGSVVLPAGMINPSVPIRNIRMKFAVLIGLIQVGEVSNRDIVETVLNLVSGRAPRPAGAPAGRGVPGHRPEQPTPSRGCSPRTPRPCATRRGPSFSQPLCPSYTHGPSPTIFPSQTPLVPLALLLVTATRSSPRRACDRSPPQRSLNSRQDPT